jgi:hypothetical protein
MVRNPNNKFEATLNISMINNEKVTPDYNLRLNQDDCTTIEMKAYGEENEWTGGVLKAYGSENVTDAFQYKTSSRDVTEKYDQRIGWCECNDGDLADTCTAMYDPAVADNQW